MSSNKVHLEVPVLPPTPRDNPTSSHPSSPIEPDGLPGISNDGLVGDVREGGNVNGEVEVDEGLTREGRAVDSWREGRIEWKGEALTALRTPLFVVEIAAAGEKGKENFAYTQRLAAVKESALVLIDKAIGSTQARKERCRQTDRLETFF